MVILGTLNLLISIGNKYLSYEKTDNNEIIVSDLTANSNWIAIIDHDDLWLPEKLNIQYDLINKNKNCFLFFSDFYLFNNKSIKSRFEVS